MKLSHLQPLPLSESYLAVCHVMACEARKIKCLIWLNTEHFLSLLTFFLSLSHSVVFGVFIFGICVCARCKIIAFYIQYRTWHAAHTIDSRTCSLNSHSGRARSASLALPLYHVCVHTTFFHSNVPFAFPKRSLHYPVNIPASVGLSVSQAACVR